MRRCLAESRSEAAALIASGRVTVTGIPTPKASSLVGVDASIHVVGDGPRYVSRGGHKLAGAVRHFELEVTGRRALDAGASTGGFTDFLLQHGVAHVTALDVGHGQIDATLRADPRVDVKERTNLRRVSSAGLGRFDLIVADLSFISLCTVAPVLADLSEPGADLVLLVKPQFEVGRRNVGKGGVVRESRLHRAAVERVVDCLAHEGLGVVGVVISPLVGAKGNREFFVHARPGVAPAHGLGEALS